MEAIREWFVNPFFSFSYKPIYPMKIKAKNITGYRQRKNHMLIAAAARRCGTVSLTHPTMFGNIKRQVTFPIIANGGLCSIS